jgi:hypothetical protein
MQTEAATLRRWAMQCAAVADDPAVKPEERERLLKMRTALLAQDWLDGRKPQKPPRSRSSKKTRPSEALNLLVRTPVRKIPRIRPNFLLFRCAWGIPEGSS